MQWNEPAVTGNPVAPGPMDQCPYCGRRCHVPVTRAMPDRVRRAYENAQWEFMSTCERGILAEHGRLGASYADVIFERLGRVGHAVGPATIRDLLAELREAARHSHRATSRGRGRRAGRGAGA